MPDSSLDHLASVIDEVAGRLRELKTENAYLKEEIRRQEQELEGLKEELAVRRDEVARLSRTRNRVRVLAKRVLNHLAGIENSSDEASGIS